MTTTREILRHALHDAINWQLGLADAWPKGSPERQEARDQAAAYRKILERRYGSPKTPMEQALDGAETVTLAQLIKQSKGASS